MSTKVCDVPYHPDRSLKSLIHERPFPGPTANWQHRVLWVTNTAIDCQGDRQEMSNVYLTNQWDWKKAKNRIA